MKTIYRSISLLAVALLWGCGGSSAVLANIADYTDAVKEVLEGNDRRAQAPAYEYIDYRRAYDAGDGGNAVETRHDRQRLVRS